MGARLRINDATASFPFPILGIDSDNGSEFINWELFRWCEAENLTFIRSPSGDKNDGPHVEQKNWHVVRQTVGYHRYNIPADRGTVPKRVKTILKAENVPLNPAAIQRHMQALAAELLTLTTLKQGPKLKPAIRTKLNDSTNQPRRAWCARLSFWIRQLLLTTVAPTDFWPTL